MFGRLLHRTGRAAPGPSQAADVLGILQRGLLPGRLATDERLEVAVGYRPADRSLSVGGDWYDVFRLGDDMIAVTVGDAVGRGIHAATAMGQLRPAVRAIALVGGGPAQVLAGLDRFVDQFEPGRMATAVYAEIELGSGRMRFACAGHPPPVVVTSSGAVDVLWDGRSPPLGVPPNAGRQEGERTLEPGHRLLLFTDGLVERRDRAFDVGLAQLVARAGPRWTWSLTDLVDDLCLTMLADEGTRDDVCLLAVALTGAEPGPPLPTSPPPMV